MIMKNTSFCEIEFAGLSVLKIGPVDFSLFDIVTSVVTYMYHLGTPMLRQKPNRVFSYLNKNGNNAQWE